MERDWLTQHVRSLVQGEWAVTPKQVETWLNVYYQVSSDTVRVTLYRLAKRGIIKRIARGVYAYQPDNLTPFAPRDHHVD